MKDDIKFIFAFLVEKPAPLRRPKPHYQVGLKEKISLKKITPIFAFIAKLCPIFEICDDL